MNNFRADAARSLPSATLCRKSEEGAAHERC